MHVRCCGQSEQNQTWSLPSWGSGLERSVPHLTAVVFQIEGQWGCMTALTEERPLDGGRATQLKAVELAAGVVGWGRWSGRKEQPALQWP